MLLMADLTPVTSDSRRQSREANPFFFPSPAREHQNESSFTIPGNRFSFGTVTVGGQSLISRRPRGRRLRPLLISGRRRATDQSFDWRGVSERRGDGQDVVEEEGRELFSNFVQQQAESENPEAARRLEIGTPDSFRNPELRRIGRELRFIAQTLVNSPQRQSVRQRASQVPPTITYSEFRSLLRELFAADGVTREGIVVLFFFCSDVALNSLSQRGSDLCAQFLRWSLSFISGSVCAWVRSHGGWSVVMSAGFSALSVSLGLAGVILVGFGVIKYVTSSS